MIVTFLRTTSTFGRLPWGPSDFSTRVIFGMRSAPSTTLPKTEWRSSSQGVSFSVMKNWLPLVLRPLFAIDSTPGPT